MTPEEYAAKLVEATGSDERNFDWQIVACGITLAYRLGYRTANDRVDTIRAAIADTIRQAQADALACPLPSPVSRETLDALRESMTVPATEITGTSFDELRVAIQQDLSDLFRHIDHLEHLLAEAAQDPAVWCRAEAYQRGFEDGRAAK